MSKERVRDWLELPQADQGESQPKSGNSATFMLGEDREAKSSRPSRSWAGYRIFGIIASLAILLFALSLWSTQSLIAAFRGQPQAAIEDVPAPTDGTVTIDAYVSQGRLLRLDSAVDNIFIADPSIADVRVVAADLIYVYGKKTGTTNLIATAAEQKPEASSEDKVRASIRLRVLLDPHAANDSLRELHPNTAVNLAVFGKRVVAVGRTKTVDEAVDAAAVAQTYSPPGQPPMNNTTVDGAQQINIRVRFAEVQRHQLENLGVNWNMFVSGGSFMFGLVTGTSSTSAVTSGASSGAGVGFSSGNFNVNAFIEALQRSGVLNILAEPNLTALTGETASFLAGGEFPIPVAQGNQTMSVQYKSFGVQLQFTPTLVKQNRISMRIKPEVSSMAGSVKVAGSDFPSFSVRRAETTVDAASGQTFAIAGLFQREMSRDIEKFPLMGDLPVLGALFRSESYKRNESELVILITPYLVNPVSDKNLATPLDRVVEQPEARPLPPPEKTSTKDMPVGPSAGLIAK